jgi:hypothetical protein
VFVDHGMFIQPSLIFEDKAKGQCYKNTVEMVNYHVKNPIISRVKIPR